MSWTTGRMCALDFESSGVDVLTARIVQAAVVDLIPADPGVAERAAYETDRWSSLVWPGDGFEMPEGAEAVHHISTEQCRDEGVDSLEAVGYVATKLAEVWAAGGVVVGFNLGTYDLSLLAAELRRHGQPPLEIGPVVDGLTLDRCDLLHRRHRFRKNTDIAPDGKPVGSRKLVDAVRWWDVPMDPNLAHDASEDAIASARVVWKIARLHPQIAAMSAADLHAYQARQHAAWAENFEAYKRKKMTEDGADQADIDDVHIDRDWPVRAELLPAARTAVA